MSFLTRVYSTLPLMTRHRSFSGFSMVGPKTLNEILKKEKVASLNKADVMDLWMTYHENKDGVHGAVLERKQGLTLIQRASEWCVSFRF